MHPFGWGLVTGVLVSIYLEGVYVTFASERTWGNPWWAAAGRALLWPYWTLRR